MLIYCVWSSFLVLHIKSSVEPFSVCKQWTCARSFEVENGLLANVSNNFLLIWLISLHKTTTKLQMHSVKSTLASFRMQLLYPTLKLQTIENRDKLNKLQFCSAILDPWLHVAVTTRHCYRCGHHCDICRGQCEM